MTGIAPSSAVTYRLESPDQADRVAAAFPAGGASADGVQLHLSREVLEVLRNAREIDLQPNIDEAGILWVADVDHPPMPR